MDFLALYIALRLSHTPLHLARAVVAALVGAVWALAAALIELYEASVSHRIFIFVGAMACAAVMTSIAASERIPSLRLTVTYLAVSAALGGVMTAIYSFVGGADASATTTSETSAELSPIAFIFAAVIAGAVSIVYTRLKERSVLKKRVGVTVFANKKSVSLEALSDSGNLLRDPVSGKPVIIISSQKLLGTIFSESSDAEKAPDYTELAEILKSDGFRLVPTRSVTGQGMLPCFCPDRIVLDGRSVDALVGIGNSEDFGGCDGIVPQILLDE